jgi:ribonucleoside-diphosphate reductase alpha chain
MFLDNSACNLASLNLRKFQDEEGELNVEAFCRAIDLIITAQDIIVDASRYPTQSIERNSHDFRSLGLGYANLGALLMSRGLPYDSDPGRAYAAAVTALLTGRSYLQSVRLSREVTGPFRRYPENERPFLEVMRKHRRHLDSIDSALVPYDLMEGCSRTWDEVIQEGTAHGFRNAQVTVLAPTGTIGFMMDCDTTGIEPDIALVKYKQLVGGGTLKLANNSVKPALKRLGYNNTQADSVLEHINENDTIEGAKELKDEHLPVFDCALKPRNGTRSIDHMGHLRMMAAVQPFLSGAISKTVNLPSEITVEEIEEVYVSSWRMGLKAVALYRDGCKRTQPLMLQQEGAKAEREEAAVQAETRPPVPVRRRLPQDRVSMTHKFEVAGHEGYLTMGYYDNGSPGEIFIRMAKEGSTISGLMDSFATAISLALQHGVPLKLFCDKFSYTRFEPSGFTNNREIPMASSLMDYIFRYLAREHLEREEHPVARKMLPSIGGTTDSGFINPSYEAETMALQAEATEDMGGTIEQDLSTFVRETDAPACPVCGFMMVRNGACYKCENCGATSGCS